MKDQDIPQFKNRAALVESLRSHGFSIMEVNGLFEFTEKKTLRDYFAGQALIGDLAFPSPGEPVSSVMAKRAYGFADAMLAEREKEPKP